MLRRFLSFQLLCWNMRITSWTSASLTALHIHTGCRTSWTFSRGLCLSSERKVTRWNQLKDRVHPWTEMKEMLLLHQLVVFQGRSEFLVCNFPKLYWVSKYNRNIRLKYRSKVCCFPTFEKLYITSHLRQFLCGVLRLCFHPVLSSVMTVLQNKF